MKNQNTQKDLKERILAFLRRGRTEVPDKLDSGPSFSTASELPRSGIMDVLASAAILLDILTEGMRNEKKSVQEISNGISYCTDPCLPENLFVRFRKLDSLDPYKHGITESLRLNGFTVNATFIGEPLAVNQVIEISMRGPQEMSEPMEAIGCVQWIKEKEGNNYEMGIMLTYMNEEDSKRLIKYFCEEING